jgi:hypothetical protein
MVIKWISYHSACPETKRSKWSGGDQAALQQPKNQRMEIPVRHRYRPWT